MRNYKAFIIDLDGTLLDTTKDIGLALGKVFGTTFTDSQTDRFVGRGLRNAVKAAAEEIGQADADIDNLTEKLIDFYREKNLLTDIDARPATEKILAEFESKFPHN